MEEAHRNVLVTRAEALNKLALLYKSRSVRFKAVAQKFVEGALKSNSIHRYSQCKTYSRAIRQEAYCNI